MGERIDARTVNGKPKPKCKTCDIREVEHEGDECDRCQKQRQAIIDAARRKSGNGKK